MMWAGCNTTGLVIEVPQSRSLRKVESHELCNMSVYLSIYLSIIYLSLYLLFFYLYI